MMVWGWAMVLGLSPAARADSGPEVDVHGDVKSFFVGTFPYDNALFEQFGLMPADPTGQGTLDGRLKLSVKSGGMRLLAHHAVTAQTSARTLSSGQTGLGVQSPQFFDLDWRGFEDSDPTESMGLQGRTDRLSLATRTGPLRPVTI